VAFLQIYEVSTRHNDKGYYCGLCLYDWHTFYTNREELWQKHLFEPFIEWMNNELEPANWLELYRLDKGDTKAELLVEPDPKATHLLPHLGFGCYGIIL
jgi:hypothetical protein